MDRGYTTLQARRVFDALNSRLKQHKISLDDTTRRHVRNGVAGDPRTANVSRQMFTAFGICRYLKNKNGDKFDNKQIALVEDIFLKPEKSLSRWQRDIKPEVVAYVSETYVRSVCHALLLSRMTGSSVGDWRTYRSIHKRITSLSADPRGVDIAHQAKSRDLFKFALPAIRNEPYSVRSFLKHRNSSPILRLREFIQESAANPNHKIDNAAFINAFKLLATQPKEFEAKVVTEGRDGRIEGLSADDSSWVAMLVENRSVNQSGKG